MFDSATDDPSELLVVAEALCDFRNSKQPAPEYWSEDNVAPSINGPAAPVPELLPHDASLDDAPADLIPSAPTLDDLVVAHGLQRMPAAFSPPSPPNGPSEPSALSGDTTDSTGVVWSAAQHTSTKSKTIDGRWKPRKPRDATPPAPPVPVVTNSTSVPPPPPIVAKVQGVPVTQAELPAALAAMPAPVPPPPPAAPTAAPTGIDFPTFITKLTQGMNDGTVNQANVAEIQARFGIDSLFWLNDREASKLQDVAAAFGFV